MTGRIRCATIFVFCFFSSCVLCAQMLLVSLGCLFLTAPSVFSNVYTSVFSSVYYNFTLFDSHTLCCLLWLFYYWSCSLYCSAPMSTVEHNIISKRLNIAICGNITFDIVLNNTLPSYLDEMQKVYWIQHDIWPRPYMWLYHSYWKRHPNRNPTIITSV